jgi:hypothetical protein
VVLGLAVADRLGGGTEGPVSAVIEFDGDRVFGDWPLVAVLLPRAPASGQGK